MPTYQITETIAANPDTIWPVLADVVHWPDWTPTVSKVEALDGPTLALGSRFKVTQPKLRPAIWTVTSVNSPNYFTWSARSPGLRMVAEHFLKLEEPGTTRLELKLTFAGLLGPVIGTLARSLTIRYMSTEATKLKAAVQGQASQKNNG